MQYNALKTFLKTKLVAASIRGSTVNKYLSTLRPLIVGELIKKSVLAIFPEETNGEGVNKWKWVNFASSA